MAGERLVTFRVDRLIVDTSFMDVSFSLCDVRDIFVASSATALFSFLPFVWPLKFPINLAGAML